MRCICADIGNSHVRIAVYADGVMQSCASFSSAEASAMAAWVHRAGPAGGAILSAVAPVPDGLEEALRDVSAQYEHLTCHTPLPITNCYQTPQTLGTDRIAAAVGARMLFPERPVLVIDAGTAVTFDLVTADGRYLGGTISPGLRMRFEALHQHAAQLPLEAPAPQESLAGRTTREAVTFGVQNGLAAEAAWYAEQWRLQHEQLAVALTGGDADFLAGRLKKWTKCPIFAQQNLVLDGLQAVISRLVEDCSRL